MRAYTSNISVVVGGFKNKLIELSQNPDAMLRTVALAVLPEVKKRIHIEGKDSNGNAIGTYSPGYMKVRTGNFINSGRFVKGKNKGQLKDAGVKTKQQVATPFGKSRYAVQNIEADGIARPNYNRTADTKVIISLTRQLENDWSVIANGTGYGLGFNNADNFKKFRWCEATYKKDIGKTTTSEKEFAVQVAQQFTSEFLKN
jgi:hypothetical protein